MDFDLVDTMDGDVLVVTVSGRVTEENADAMTERFYEILSESNATRVLVDRRPLAGHLSLASLYFHMRSLAGRHTHRATVVIVDCEENRQHAEFHETTAANAGHPLKYFFDYDEALTWLRNR